MRRRIGTLFTIVPLISILCACKTSTAPVEDEKQAAINVALAHERAVQDFDFDKVDSLHTPDIRVIEESFPHPLEPEERRDWQAMRDAGVHVEYHPQDTVAEVRGNVAWVTLTLRSLFTADAPAGRAMIGGEWHVTFVETFILVKTPGGWKIAFRHTSQLPADFGIDPD
jgi:ketosteroid isomerase-like protein